MAQLGNPHGDLLWWEVVPLREPGVENPREDERLDAHVEFATKRRQLFDELSDWMIQASQSGEIPWSEAAEEALDRLGGFDGDLAHRAWVFEMDEAERKLFRRLREPAFMATLLGRPAFSAGGPKSEAFVTAACDPAGAEARRLARVLSLLMGIERAADPLGAPFALEGAEPEESSQPRLRRWKERPETLDRRPWIAEIERAYPDLAAQKLFEGIPGPQDPNGQASCVSDALRRRVAGLAASSTVSPEARAMAEAMRGGRAPATEQWPSASLKAWLEACEISQASAPGRAAAGPRL